MRSEKEIQTQLDKCKVADESVSALEWVLEDKTKRYSVEDLENINGNHKYVIELGKETFELFDWIKKNPKKVEEILK